VGGFTVGLTVLQALKARINVAVNQKNAADLLINSPHLTFILIIDVLVLL
jgi:hypothetical protein